TARKSRLYAPPPKTYAAAGRCVQKKDPAEAAQYFDRAMRLDPNNLQAMVPYADLLYRGGRYQQAKELVGRYNKLVPEPTAESLWLALRGERKLGDQLAEQSLATQLRRRYPNSPEYQSLIRGNFERPPTMADLREDSPGRVLAAARQARGMTVTEVALRLKFAPRQIEALEADRYEELPPPTIARGMIRGYAKLLTIAPEPLIEALPPGLRAAPV